MVLPAWSSVLSDQSRARYLGARSVERILRPAENHTATLSVAAALLADIECRFSPLRDAPALPTPALQFQPDGRSRTFLPLDKSQRLGMADCSASTIPPPYFHTTQPPTDI